jgi:hypothetical protein
MARRKNGSRIGIRNITSASVAVGIWDLSDQQVSKRANLWPIPPIVAQVLLVGGGGGGQTGHSPGGSGGYVEALTGDLVPGTTYTLTLGGGGGGGPRGPSGASGSAGGTTSMTGSGFTTLTAAGGPGSNSYGDGNTNPPTGGGNQRGGDGQQSTITGSNAYYGGGGGVGGGAGYEQSPGGQGGSGGGGFGSQCCGQPGQSGQATGGGGGGGGIQWCGTVYCEAASGTTGVAIVSYSGAQLYTGGTVTTSGGNTIHYFTGSGNLTPI